MLKTSHFRPDEYFVETAGLAHQEGLFFDPDPTRCGKIKDGVALGYRVENFPIPVYFVIAAEDLVEMATLTQQKRKINLPPARRKNLKAPWALAHNPKSTTINDDQGHIIARLLRDAPERLEQAAAMASAPELFEENRRLRAALQLIAERAAEHEKLPDAHKAEIQWCHLGDIALAALKANPLPTPAEPRPEEPPFCSYCHTFHFGYQDHFGA